MVKKRKMNMIKTAFATFFVGLERRSLLKRMNGGSPMHCNAMEALLGWRLEMSIDLFSHLLLHLCLLLLLMIVTLREIGFRKV